MRHSAIRYFALAAMPLFVMSISGCSPSPNDPIAISGFSVNGTSAVSQGVVPINPGVNNGQFSINWNITGNIYTAVVALNAGPVFDPNTNIVLANSCGKQSSRGVCHTTETLNCTFDNSNNMQCSDHTGPYTVQNLTLFLNAGVPDNAYLVLQACNPAGNLCLTGSVPIQIQ